MSRVCFLRTYLFGQSVLHFICFLYVTFFVYVLGQMSKEYQKR